MEFMFELMGALSPVIWVVITTSILSTTALIVSTVVLSVMAFNTTQAEKVAQNFYEIQKEGE